MTLLTISVALCDSLHVKVMTYLTWFAKVFDFSSLLSPFIMNFRNDNTCSSIAACYDSYISVAENPLSLHPLYPELLIKKNHFFNKVVPEAVWGIGGL